MRTNVQSNQRIYCQAYEICRYLVCLDAFISVMSDHLPLQQRVQLIIAA